MSKGSDEPMVRAAILVRLGEREEALDVIAGIIDKASVSELLYDYELHPLQSMPEFVRMLEKAEIYTKKDSETGLLVQDMLRDVEAPDYSEYEALSELKGNIFDWADEINRRCPVSMGAMGNLTSVDINEYSRVFTMNVRLNPDYDYIINVMEDPEMARQNEESVGMQLVMSNPLVVDSGIAMIYNYTSSDGRKKYKIEFTPGRLRQLAAKASSQEEVDRMTLQSWETLEQRAFDTNPEMAGSKAYYDDDWFVYDLYISDEDGVFSSVEMFPEVTRTQYANMLKGLEYKQRLPILIRMNMGIKIIIRDRDSSRKVEFNFTPDDLRKITEQYK